MNLFIIHVLPRNLPTPVFLYLLIFVLFVNEGKKKQLNSEMN